MQKEGDLSLLRRFWPYIRPYRYALWVAIFLMPLTTAAVLLQPWLLKYGLDHHIIPAKTEGIFWVAAFYLCVVVAHYLLEASYMLCVAHAGQHGIAMLREEIYQHLLSLPPAFFDKHPAGMLLTRATSDVEAVGETLTSGVISIFLDVLIASGILFVMFWMHWLLTLLLLLILPPLFWILGWIRKRLRQDFIILRDALASLNAYLAERLQGVEVIQLSGYEKGAQSEFERRNTLYKDAAVRSNLWDALMYAVVDGVGSLCIALMLWYALSPSLQAWGGAISIGLLAAFIEYLQRLFRPLQEFSGKIAIIQRATTALEKIFSLLDEKPQQSRGSEYIERIQGAIEFRDVFFAYDKEDVLKGITFSVQPGDVVALVGSTGCGKTTITRLLHRNYDGYRGSIQLDGKEIRDLSLQQIRENIAAVKQDLHLFSETVRFNVALDNPKIQEEHLADAARLTHAKQILQGWPRGWEHQIQAKGGNLSVGESQILTFARTIAYQAPILILDEATASIDPKTEALIQDALEKIFSTKTVIVVAHRLSTITAAKKILVLQKGQIVEQGTHKELLQMQGHYAKLYQSGFAL
jgi:ATP-binding cassette subfamily B protein